MEQQYQYLDQFIRDTNINPDLIAIKEIEIDEFGVNIFLVEKDSDVLTICRGYSTAIDKPVRADSISRVILRKCKLEQLISLF